MSDIVLGLGPIIFHDFELPAGIAFGGRQQLAVHELADGRRIIDCMGRRDADIEFAGTLSGPDAGFRARELDRLRIAAMPLPLSWDVFCFTVVVRELGLNYQNDRWIPYRIRCAVQQDETSAFAPQAISEQAFPWIDLDTAITQSSAAGLVLGLPTDFSLQGLTFGTESYFRVHAELDDASFAVTAGIAEREQYIDQTDFGAQSPEQMLDTLSARVDAIRRLDLLVRARNCIGRAAANLSPESLSL
jgi:hypothetical protein